MKDDGLKAVQSYLHKTCSKKKLIELLLERVNWYQLSRIIMQLDQEETQREAKLIGKCENDTDSVKKIGKTVKKGAARWQGCERALDEIRRHLAEEWEV